MSSIDAVISEAQSLRPAAPKDLTEILPNGKRHPNDRPLGPLKPRGDLSGLVLQSGEIVAHYGNIESPEVTFSVAKSYLSALAGIAWRDGLITNLDEAVAEKISDGGFDSKQNRSITWRHLMQQTSEWEGELFGIPDWIDRGRQVGSSATMSSAATVGGTADSSESSYRALRAPGSFWEYNDVRVNRFSLALLRLFGEPLPRVLAREIMAPVGASESWEWHGYETSWVEVNSEKVQSVSGGTHWGGGLWISTLDHARIGSLYLNNGSHEDRQILPADWIEMTRTPCDINPAYGLLWWLNHEGAISEVAGEDAYAARGAGGNVIFIWPENAIVIVLRWCIDTKRIIDAFLTAL